MQAHAMDTASQMAATLHYALSQDRLHAAFNSLSSDFNNSDNQSFILNTVNALWGSEGV